MSGTGFASIHVRETSAVDPTIFIWDIDRTLLGGGLRAFSLPLLYPLSLALEIDNLEINSGITRTFECP